MRAALPLSLALLVGSAAAMTDPTQPPTQLLAPKAAASAPAVTPAAPLRLQGLRVGDSALIDGRLRRVGERWQGYQLLRAEGQAAWLRDPEGRLLRLSLLPLTERRP
jgi:hypothetical protein